MIANVLQPKNLYKAARRVVQNNGASGIDGMKVSGLRSSMDLKRNTLIQSILDKNYVPQAILGVPIPKSIGKARLLGIPTVTHGEVRIYL